MENLHIMEHPLILHKISLLRDKNTQHINFKQLVEEVSMLICYKATEDAFTRNIKIETPMEETIGKEVVQKYGIIPIMRAGMGMLDGIAKLMPTAKIGHIGLYREPRTLEPIEYYCKLPKDIADREVLLLDPMVGTGGTATTAITFLKDRGVKNIKLLALITCETGVNLIHKMHPDVIIYTAAHDKILDDRGYVIPGMGDAGDRLYGTQ